MKLAQVNVSLMRNEPTDPRMKGLVGRVEGINKWGDMAPGFVWRIPGDEIHPKSLSCLFWLFEPFHANRIFCSMSVWGSIEDLENFVYRTGHLSLLREKDQWIDPGFSAPQLVLW